MTDPIFCKNQNYNCEIPKLSFGGQYVYGVRTTAIITLHNLKHFLPSLYWYVR